MENTEIQSTEADELRNENDEQLQTEHDSTRVDESRQAEWVATGVDEDSHDGNDEQSETRLQNENDEPSQTRLQNENDEQPQARLQNGNDEQTFKEAVNEAIDENPALSWEHKIKEKLSSD